MNDAQTELPPLEKPSKKEQAGFIRNLFILFIVVGRTLWTATMGILNGYFGGKRKRKIADGLLQSWSRRLLRTARLTFTRYPEEGFDFDEGRAYVLMSNHQSHFDIPTIFQALPHQSIRMLTKKELFKVPVFGRGMHDNEFISIDRQNQRQAIKDLERAKNALQSGIRLWVSPEGTRSKSGRLGAFKRGGFKIAIDTGALILPIGLRNINRTMWAGTLKVCPGQHAEVHIGTPIDTADYGKDKVRELMAEVEKQIRTLAGL